MHHPVAIFFTNQSTFDWINFFGNVAGSFIGAVIVLGIERVLSKQEQTSKKDAEFKAVQSALDTEVECNIKICSDRAVLIQENSTRPLLAIDLDTKWLEKFVSDYIDYSDQDSRRLFSYLHSANTLIKRLNLQQSQLDSFYVNGSALDNYQSRVQKMNESILKTLRSINETLGLIKDLREGIKVDFEKAMKHPLFNSRADC